MKTFKKLFSLAVTQIAQRAFLPSVCVQEAGKPPQTRHWVCCMMVAIVCAPHPFMFAAVN